jgi:GntP family gluconate:H+ symporter
VAVPTLVICGPLLARLVEKWVPVRATTAAAGMTSDVPAGSVAISPAMSGAGGSGTGLPSAEDAEGDDRLHHQSGVAEGVTHRRGFFAAVISITLPVILMLARAIAELTINDEESNVQKFLVFVGTPAVALLAAVLVAMFALRFNSGMNRSQVEKSTGSALPGIAGILLIVAAGGGFKAMLVDAGVGDVIGDWAEGAGISVLLLSLVVV